MAPGRVASFALAARHGKSSNAPDPLPARRLPPCAVRPHYPSVRHSSPGGPPAEVLAAPGPCTVLTRELLASSPSFLAVPLKYPSLASPEGSTGPSLFPARSLDEGFGRPARFEGWTQLPLGSPPVVAAADLVSENRPSLSPDSRYSLACIGT